MQGPVGAGVHVRHKRKGRSLTPCKVRGTARDGVLSIIGAGVAKLANAAAF